MTELSVDGLRRGEVVCPLAMKFGLLKSHDLLLY